MAMGHGGALRPCVHAPSGPVTTQNAPAPAWARAYATAVSMHGWPGQPGTVVVQGRATGMSAESAEIGRAVALDGDEATARAPDSYRPRTRGYEVRRRYGRGSTADDLHLPLSGGDTT